MSIINKHFQEEGVASDDVEDAEAGNGMDIPFPIQLPRDPVKHHELLLYPLESRTT